MATAISEPVVAPRAAGFAAQRLASLDIFRGMTLASMVLVNNPGSDQVYAPLEHAPWNGWTFTDTVFPFFLWMVGVAMTLSTAKRVERGESRRNLFLHAFRRAAIIFAIGLFLNAFPYFHLSTLRIPGVLQRIAVCYLIAAAIFLLVGVRGIVISIVLLLSSYWLLMMYAPVPGYGAGHLDQVPRLIAALGTQRERYQNASEVQCFSGIAPVVASSGKQCWVHYPALYLGESVLREAVGQGEVC